MAPRVREQREKEGEREKVVVVGRSGGSGR